MTHVIGDDAWNWYNDRGSQLRTTISSQQVSVVRQLKHHMRDGSVYINILATDVFGMSFVSFKSDLYSTLVKVLLYSVLYYNNHFVTTPGCIIRRKPTTYPR